MTGTDLRPADEAVSAAVAAADAAGVWLLPRAGALTEPHTARLRPAANATAGIAITLLSFIVLRSPSAEKPHFTLG